VSWIGWVARAADFVSQIDLLIVPSSEFDPFPTVLLEAGAASRPAFAANVGGVAEILDHEKTGWVFDPGAVADAARQLSDVMANPSLLTVAGKAAALRVREQFSVDRMAKDYGMLYSER
jgi:glycosyltransferase involved in cell wall biosynthesis